MSFQRPPTFCQEIFVLFITWCNLFLGVPLSAENVAQFKVNIVLLSLSLGSRRANRSSLLAMRKKVRETEAEWECVHSCSLVCRLQNWFKAPGHRKGAALHSRHVPASSSRGSSVAIERPRLQGPKWVCFVSQWSTWWSTAYSTFQALWSWKDRCWFIFFVPLCHFLCLLVPHTVCVSPVCFMTTGALLNLIQQCCFFFSFFFRCWNAHIWPGERCQGFRLCEGTAIWDIACLIFELDVLKCSRRSREAAEWEPHLHSLAGNLIRSKAHLWENRAEVWSYACQVHIFTEACLHHIIQNHAVALDIWTMFCAKGTLAGSISINNAWCSSEALKIISKEFSSKLAQNCLHLFKEYLTFQLFSSLFLFFSFVLSKSLFLV